MATPPTNALGGISGALANYLGTQKLTAAQKNKIATLLFKKLGSRACEMCSHTEWAISDHIAQPTPLQLNPLTKSYSTDFMASYPSIYLVCTNCGNSKFFLLSQLGFDPFEAEG